MEIEGALRILGLTHRASRKEARSAYRRLAKTWHPDLVQGTPDVVRDAEERMKSLNAAYLRVSKYLAGRKSPPKTDKPWWWGKEPPPAASARAIRRPAWFRGFTFDDPSRFRDDLGDYIAAAAFASLGPFLLGYAAFMWTMSSHLIAVMSLIAALMHTWSVVDAMRE